MEKGTASLYLAQAEKEVHDFIRRENRKSGKCYAAMTVMIVSLQTVATISLPKRVVINTEKNDKTEPGLFKKFRCSEPLCLCSKTYCCYDPLSNKYNFSCK